jgi:hypothetical protein
VELGFLERNRLLVFSAALALLAFALGSLPRSQPGGPSILLNSYWLIYLLSLAPIITLGLMVVMIGFLAYNWRTLSDALGFGIASKRRQQKKRGRGTPMLVWLTAWAIGLGVLLQKCGGVFCSSVQKTGGLQSPVQQFVTGPGPGPVVPYIQLVSQISSFVQASWFSMAFLGFLIVSSVIIVRGVKVSWDERMRVVSLVPALEVEGESAVEDAIRILESQETLDPRTRIIDCYQRMVKAAQHLGAPITPDQTARELESAMRKMLILRGPAIGDLTKLFEEARYSLHSITEKDAEEAHRCLLDIAEEMKLPVSV